MRYDTNFPVVVPVEMSDKMYQPLNISNPVLRNKVPVKIKRLSEDAVIPRYATELAAGFDLVAIEDVIIEPGETALIKTGIAVQLPEGYEMQIRPRSGISLKTKLRVQLGTIDADYTGEVGVIVDNIAHSHMLSTFMLTTDGSKQLLGRAEHGDYIRRPAKTCIIRKGDRICQAVIAEVPQAIFEVVDSLDETERGDGGFGSTGVKEGE